jgi:hypothetical protein
MATETSWIDWAGGECPVRKEAIVEVRLADGSEWFPGRANQSAAKYWDWDGEQHRPNKNIVAYRVVSL